MTADGLWLERLVKLLDAAGIRYMVAGSVGSNVYGHPRTTNDIDIIIAATEAQIECFLASLSNAYANVRSGRQAIEDEMFYVIDYDTGMKADLILLKDRDFSRSEFARRRLVEIDGVPAWIVSAEDAILSKLEWSKIGESERQFRDAFNVAALMWPNLDLEYLQKWAVQLNVVKSLNEVLGQVRETTSERSDEHPR